jgi:hypothetical protein
MAGLAVLCAGFGSYDRTRTDSDANARRARRFAPIHWAMAGAIVVGIAVALGSAQLGIWPTHGILAGEAIAILAFGVSWTLKSAELWTSAMRGID